MHKPVPDMTYNVFGGTLSLTQLINHAVAWSSAVKYVLHNLYCWHVLSPS